MFYLAEKIGRFLASSGASRATAMQWVFFQMANIGPMFGQANHFVSTAPERIPYATERYVAESARLVAVLDRRLGEAEFLAGEYSIADICSYPWVAMGFDLLRSAKPEVTGDGAHVARWIAACAARPAVARGMNIPQSN
jgi:GST-like protein